MMARNTNVPFKGRIQKRKTYHLQIITFGLQRAAGPYRRAITRHKSSVSRSQVALAAQLSAAATRSLPAQCDGACCYRGRQVERSGHETMQGLA